MTADNIPIPTGLKNNEDTVIDYHISKYFCRKKAFDRKDFLVLLIEEKQMGAFGFDNIKQGISNISNEINKDIKRSLERLEGLGLVTKKNGPGDFDYIPTKVLTLLCPTILKYQITIISNIMNEVIEVEDKIEQLGESERILSFLDNLEQSGPMDISSIKMNESRLTELVQLSVIDVWLNTTASISQLGKVINQRNKDRQHKNVV